MAKEDFNLQKFIVSVVIIGVVLVLGIYITDLIGDTVMDTDTAVTVTNETTAYVNETGYTLDNAGALDFASATITGAWNYTDDDGTVIVAANYSLSDAGVLTNATDFTWASVNVSYTYTYTATNDASDAADDVVDALATGTSWISILVVVGFAVIVLTMLTSGLGASARREDVTPYY